MPDAFTVLIMAAGKGTRMHSETPKVLHRVCGKPMVEWVIDTAREAGAGRVVCVVRPGDGVAEGLPEQVEVAEQREGEGTGAAVLAARDLVDTGPVVVLSGDQPLITAEALRALVADHTAVGAGATLLTTDGLDPAGYGRIVRDAEGDFERIVETKYTEGVPAEELAIREVNLGTYVFEAPNLFVALDEVGDEAGERYLTGVFPLFHAEGQPIVTHMTHDARIAFGVNDRADLMIAEELAQRRIIEDHARAGVTFLGPASTRIEAQVTIGADTTVAPGVNLIGATEIGPGCEIGPNATLVDCGVEAEATILNAYAVDAQVGAGRHRRSVRLPASRHGAASRRQGRQLRGDQELGHRRGRQDPSPLLYRRHRCGRGRQPRRQHDHRELRRAAQAPHQDRKEREDKRPHDPGGAR